MVRCNDITLEIVKDDNGHEYEVIAKAPASKLSFESHLIIILTKRVGPAGPSPRAPFVVWETNLKAKGLYSGYYCSEIETAIGNFKERIFR